MRYKLFGHSGLRVSELSLGTMTFGTEWGWGADWDTSKAIFDTYAEAGGNFIDTANRYTEGTSEKFVGELTRADRDHFVIATKYTLYDRTGDPNFGGNHRKNLIRSVEASLKRLQTDYIDILWLHAWDFTTSVQEIMRGLDDLVRMGKIHYLGISDTPAWIVSQANTLAELRGWSAFAGLQIEYSLIQRTPERDLLPMAKAFDLAVTPWGAIGGGALTGKYLSDNDEPKRLKEGSARLNERSTRIARTVVECAKEMGVSPAQLAINWTRQKEFTSIPIVGARKVSHIQDSLGCLTFTIPDDIMKRLEGASHQDLGFPHEFLQSDGVQQVIFGGTYSDIDFRS
ncbi:MAG: aldo/keto reductase [Bacteroidota bacterium]